MSEERIALTGVRKVYGKTVALDGLELQVGRGELVGLIGPNGAGKTTLLRILSGHLLPTSGAVRIAGVDVAADPGGARAKMGYVPEEPSLYEYLTAREFLEFVVGVRGRGDIEAALDMAGLGSDADRLIREYSQGMRRRTALAAAVVSRPEVLILDESLNGLDPVSGARVEAHLQRLVAAGTTILLSTHLLEGVERISTRVVMMRGGRIVADEPTASLGEEGVRALFHAKLA